MQDQVNALKVKLSYGNDKHLEAIIDSWNKMYGVDNNEGEDDRMAAFYEEFLIDLSGQAKSSITAAEQAIQGLIKEAAELEVFLREKIILPSIDELPLLPRIEAIDASLAVFRRKSKERENEFAALQAEEIALNEELAERPIKLKESLPSSQDIEEIKQRIANKLKIKEARVERILKLQTEVTEAEVSLGLERKHPKKLSPSLDTISQLETQLQDLKDMSMKKKIKETLSSVQKLRLELDMTPIPENVGINEESLFSLLNEKKLWEALKESRIKDSIMDMRSQITEMMGKCQKSARYISKSISNSEIKFTEEFLKKHKDELRLLQEYYEQNSAIFKHLKRREALQSELAEIAKQNDLQNRFKNRGGALLKEEQLKKKLTQVEIALSQAVKEYESKHNSPFMVMDLPIKVDHNASERQMTRKNSVGDLKLRKPLETLNK